jgi:hypothetical protein
VCLLSTQNYAFAKFMMQFIRLKTNYTEYQLQSVRLDNATEFSSRVFNDYCMAQGIEVQHSVPYVHTQNDLVWYLIKRIKLIVRPLLHNCNLPITCWGHAVLHVADLIQLQPTAYHCFPTMSYTWQCSKHFSSAENWYLCEISFPIHYKVYRAHDWRFIYGPVR